MRVPGGAVEPVQLGAVAASWGAFGSIPGGPGAARGPSQRYRGAEVVALVVVVANAARCEVSFVAFGRSGQVSEARLESTFLADDAACLTLDRAVIQLRCSEIVSLGCGRLFLCCCVVSSMEYGFRQSSIPSVSSHSPSFVSD